MNPRESILVVDDEQFIRNILVRIVEREGYNVDEACDGVQAMDKLNSARYDYVISDIRMPNMDGLELLTKIKELYPATIVLIVTGHLSDDIARKARSIGADSLITKPFKNVEIARTLAELSPARRVAAKNVYRHSK